MTDEEQKVKEFFNMEPQERANIVKNYHYRKKNTIRQTAKDFNISIGTAFNCVNYDK